MYSYINKTMPLFRGWQKRSKNVDIHTHTGQCNMLYVHCPSWYVENVYKFATKNCTVYMRTLKGVTVLKCHNSI